MDGRTRPRGMRVLRGQMWSPRRQSIAGREDLVRYCRASSCASLVISHSTMAEIDHGFRRSSRVSAAVSSPATAYRKTWVSRFSISRLAGREDVALDRDLSAQ